MSTVFYLVVSIQGSLQAQMSINQAVHFSDWVIGHSHLAMLGFATFAAAGGLRARLAADPLGAGYNARAIDWSYWLLLAGVIMMVIDLTAAGVVEARLVAIAARRGSTRCARPGRTGSCGRSRRSPIAAGFIALLARR